MPKLRPSLSAHALAAGTLALSAAVSATAAHAEYMQLKLYSVKITSYSVNGSGLDDTPTPPSNVATPSPAPREPIVIRKEMDLSSPLLHPGKPGLPGGKVRSLKLNAGRLK